MDYRDKRQCRELLDHVRPANIDEAHVQLSGLLNGMLESPPSPEDHLELLEAARPMVAYVQAEISRRYAAHPLPPDSRENEILRRVVELWRTMALSYAALVPALQGDARALLQQRRIYALGQVVFEHFRAHRTVPQGNWLQLHEAFQAAEQQGLTRTRVVDPLNEAWKAQSSGEAHAQVLLVDLANPYGRSPREFELVCRWAQRFAAYCGLDESAGNRKSNSYALDLARDHGLRPGGALTGGPSLRYFDGSRLTAQIEAVVGQLKQGVTPRALGLGEDAETAEAGHLLVWLYRPWGLAASGRRFPRRQAKGLAELCDDWKGIGLYVDGKVFEPPHPFDAQASVHSDIALLTFGEKAAQFEHGTAKLQAQARKLGLEAEPWTVVDQSVGGFKLANHPRSRRLEHNQLVGVRPPDGTHFLLGQVSWLIYRPDGEMDIGIHLLPGLPHVIAARPIGLYVNPHEPYQQAFVLPAVPSMQVPHSTLVLPGGWYHPQRVVQLYHKHTHQVRLTKLLTRGSNFDHVSFESIAR